MKKILIADDNKEFCNTLKDILEELEYDIHFAHDGKETLKRIYTVNPDLMILDLNIQGMSGHEICETVRQDQFFKNLPIIVMSGNTYEEITKNKNIEANEIMTKPFDMQEILNKIRTLVDEK